ncbi:hypothetical protein C1646_664053 [Rhizophagus diaphanus]|nr:hypothetical protein C1646_664053 [Rhizophagus diaphanus] [Rhizophagus sp. MUCL 43196]
MEHNVEPFEFGKSSWANDLPLSVFTYLITKGYDNASRDLTLNLGDMKLFHNCNISGGLMRFPWKLQEFIGTCANFTRLTNNRLIHRLFIHKKNAVMKIDPISPISEFSWNTN